MAVPKALGPAGKKLYVEIEKAYDLRPDELRVLEDACREADIIAKLEEGRTDADIVVKGSMGQSVIHPIYSELRQHRSTLANLLKQLKLAEDPAAAARTRSTTARQAAQARWARG